VRSYLPDLIPQDKIERILEAGRLSPSASNMQPWHFIVVTDPQKRGVIAKGGRYARFISEAPVTIVGCGNRKASPKWHIVDTTIALQTMVLAAAGEGLGTCWIGSFEETQVKELLKIPDDFSVIALISLGYPREKLDLAEKTFRLIRIRKKFEEIASSEEFGSPLGKKP
jgi:nitroreductase